MKSRGTLYGLMGFLSLLGFLGIFTETKAFLAFFAFAVDFSYFFQPSDEMLESSMNRSAARAFYCGMVATVPGCLPGILLRRRRGAQRPADRAFRRLGSGRDRPRPLGGPRPVPGKLGAPL